MDLCILQPTLVILTMKKKIFKLLLDAGIENDIKNFITRRSYGTLGIDFNKGFIAVSETNKFGSLVDTYTLKY